jgi:hypothetical protein
LVKRLLLTLLALYSSICCAETYTITSWNLEWFPDHRPNAKAEDRAAHMAAAKAALGKIPTGIFCAQEVRDWESFDELVA